MAIAIACRRRPRSRSVPSVMPLTPEWAVGVYVSARTMRLRYVNPRTCPTLQEDGHGVQSTYGYIGSPWGP
eukprot:scaffold213044_cov31-Tisochrysis_lutea.AAC.4